MSLILRILCLFATLVKIGGNFIISDKIKGYYRRFRCCSFGLKIPKIPSNRNILLNPYKTLDFISNLSASLTLP